MQAQHVAHLNLERHIRRNPYPGRGLVVGLASAQDAWLMIYFTPRISAMLDLRNRPAALAFSLLKANPANPELTDRFTIRPAAPPPGLGVCITTYQGDGSPLPSFTGDPLLLPCGGSAAETLDLYWNALDADNKISLAVKRIPVSGGPGSIVIRNRFDA